MPDDATPERQWDELLRRLGDTTLAERLRAEGCDGAVWTLVRPGLAAYCIGTLHRIVLDGELNRRTARLGRPAGLTADELVELRDDRDERDSIVDEAVVGGLLLFRRDAILAGGWQPGGGASLLTYAANGCLLQIGDAIRRWRRQQRNRAECRGAGPELADDPVFAAHSAPDPADEIADRHAAATRLRILLGQVDEPLRSAILLRLAGDGSRSWKDIAFELKVNERKIERGLRRLRDSHRGDLRDDGGDLP